VHVCRPKFGHPTRVLITAAAAAIGLEVARDLAASGHRLWLAAHRKSPRSRRSTRPRHRPRAWMLPTQTPCFPLHRNPPRMARSRRHNPLRAELGQAGNFCNSTPKNSRTPSASIPQALFIEKPSFKRADTASKTSPRRGKIVLFAVAAQATAIRNFLPYGTQSRGCPHVRNMSMELTPPKSPSTLTSSPPVPTELPCWLPFVPPAVKSAPSSPSPSNPLCCWLLSSDSDGSRASSRSTIPIQRFRQAHSRGSSQTEAHRPMKLSRRRSA